MSDDQQGQPLIPSWFVSWEDRPEHSVEVICYTAEQAAQTAVDQCSWFAGDGKDDVVIVKDKHGEAKRFAVHRILRFVAERLSDSNKNQTVVQ